MSVCKSIADLLRSDLRERNYKGHLITQNSQEIKSGFERLAKFTKDDTNDLSLIFGYIGISSEYQKLSIRFDSGIYDIIETYELGSLLVKFGGNWTRAWTSIEAELNQSDNEVGPSLKETIQGLQTSFNELQKNLSELHPSAFDSLHFRNLLKNAKTGQIKLVSQ